MGNTRKLWMAPAILLVSPFSVMLWAGSEIFRAAVARAHHPLGWLLLLFA